MAAQAAVEGVVAQLMVSLCATVKWSHGCPTAGQGCRGGRGVMQLSVLWWVLELGEFPKEPRGRAQWHRLG